jgi:hypothetical protein
VAELGKILQVYDTSNKTKSMAVEGRQWEELKLLLQNRLILSSIVSGVSVIDFIVY